MSFMTPVAVGTLASELISTATSALRRSTTANRTASPAKSTHTFQRWPDSNKDYSNGEHEHEHEHDSPVFKYYFLFIAALGVLVGLFAWWIHWSRLQRKRQLQRSGQNALARDLENLASTCATVNGAHGTYRAAPVQCQDGLDEHGQAPPPYQPKDKVGVSIAPVGGIHSLNNHVAIPLLPLGQNENERTQPPAYSADIDRHSPTTRTPESNRL